EVASDQGAHLERLAVEGVVVAGGQGVGAQHDAALDLVTEARGAGGLHHLARGGRLDPDAVADAVVASQVRARLGRGDQVVGRQPVGGRRDRDLLDGGAGGGQGVGGGT